MPFKLIIPETSRARLKERFAAAPSEVRWYPASLPDLLDQRFPLDVALAYLFLRVELAHNKALYCGVVRVHHANSTVAKSVVDANHISRDTFIDMFETVFGKALPLETLGLLKSASEVRDRVMHGKGTLEKEKRAAIWDVVTYAEQFNGWTKAIAGFKPFGPLTGFHGRGKSLPKETTRWLLKGMGFKA